MTEEEFKTLYLAMYRHVVRFASRRLDPQVAQDIAAETFTVVWDKRFECPREPEELAAWTFGVVKNKVLQELQRPARKHHDHRYAEDHPQFEPSVMHSDVVATDRVHAAWLYEQLTVAERDLLDTATIPEITNVSAAKLLGITVGAYRTRLSRLRRRITDLHTRSDQEGAAS